MKLKIILTFSEGAGERFWPIGHITQRFFADAVSNTENADHLTKAEFQYLQSIAAGLGYEVHLESQSNSGDEK